MPGGTVTVTLAIDEVAQELSYVVEESVPEGWAVSSGGGGEISGSKISWLLIEGLAPGVTVEDKTFTYTVVVPLSVSGTAVFNGTYRFESMGSSSSILGETQVNVGSAAPSAPVPVSAPVSSPPSAPASVAYVPPPSSPAPEPTPSPVAYTPPAPEPAYEPSPAYEPYVPPVAEVYAPVPVPDTSVPVRAEQPSYEAAYEASVSSAPYGSAPSATDSPPPTDYPLPIADAVPPTPDIEPPTKTPWLWIVAGIIAVSGIIGGGIYLKQHLKQGVPAGGQHFSQQSVTYYVEQYSKLGYSKEQILSHLVKNGIPLDAVKQAISEYEKAHQVKAG